MLLLKNFYNDVKDNIAIILSILSLSGAVWCTWRDRPRLNCYFSKVIFNNMPDGKKFHMIQIKVCNIGFREIILTEFIV